MYRFLEQTVADYMTGSVVTVNRDMTMAELLKHFDNDGFNAYPVVEDEEIIGLVTKFDFLKCFTLTPSRIVPRYSDIMGLTVGEAMSSDFIYVAPTTKLTRVLQLMVDHRIRSAPVIKTQCRLVGIIAREDIMRALEICENLP